MAPSAHEKRANPDVHTTADDVRVRMVLVPEDSAAENTQAKVAVGHGSASKQHADRSQPPPPRSLMKTRSPVILAPPGRGAADQQRAVDGSGSDLLWPQLTKYCERLKGFVR